MDDLSTTEFQLLAVMGARDQSGREIASAYEREAGSSISYGTLYTTLRRLKEMGFVSSRDASDVDGRVRYFKITAQGLAALAKARKTFVRLAGFGTEASFS